MATNPAPSLPSPAPVPPRSPAPRGGRTGRGGLRVFAVVMTVLLCLSIFGNMVLLLLVLYDAGAAGGSGAGPAANVEAQTIHSGSADKIAILPVEGDVDDSMTQRVNAYCEYVKQDKSIRAVVLAVDSPGGGITASDEIHHLFTNLKGTGVPLVVSMQSLAASGGYYLSMPADKIYAEPTTLTGSIGVIWPAFELTGLMKDIGVKPEIIKSDSADAYKDAGSPFKEFTDADRAYIKGLVNNAQEKFSKVVEEGRKGKLKLPINKIAIGKIWSADEALSLGVIDEIAYLDEVCTKTAAEYSLGDPTIIRLAPRPTLLQQLGVSAAAIQPKVELKVDRATLEGLTDPHMQYRAPKLQ